MNVFILVGIVACPALLILGSVEIARGSVTRRDRSWTLEPGDSIRAESWLERVNRRFSGTALGRNLKDRLDVAGIDRAPATVVGIAASAQLAVAWLLWRGLAPLFGIASFAVGYRGVRAYLARGRDRRREAFIAQLPQLSRLLANAVSAGKPIRLAIASAGDQLDEPAKTEMQQVDSSLTFGASIDDALEKLNRRLESREVELLVSTLIVCARSGGSLVSSLLDIASTLEDRKETRREVRTVFAQSLMTGYLVIGMGFAMLFLLNGVRPGTVEKMTTEPLGQAALIVGLGLFALGIFVVRRMTKIDP